jgi:plasmid replication initiation protein
VFAEKNGAFVKVFPVDKDIGVATIWDADIIIYLISMLLDEKEKFEKTGVGINPIDRREFKIQAYDVLKFCNRSVGRKSYLNLFKAIERLSNTKYVTNIIYDDLNAKGGLERTIDQNLKAQMLNDIEMPDLKEREFSWIVSKDADYHQSKSRVGTVTKVPYMYEVMLHSRFVRSVVGSTSVLKINADFFKITGGIERWLYRVARKHEGTDKENQMGIIWTIDHLYARSMSTSTLAKFKFRIKQLAKADTLLDYKITTFKKKGKDYVHIIDRKRIVLDAMDIQDIIRELSRRKRFETQH